MKSSIKLIAFALIPYFSMAQLKYPETKKGSQTDNYHGTEVKDPYRWLEDDKSAETAAWVKAQNEVTFDYLSKTASRPPRESL
jgi:prolyl oligopeptidase